MSAASEQKTPSTDGFLKITQVRSAIGTKPKHRATLRAMGLRGVGRERVLPDRPEVRGMIARVPHLVKVSEATVAESEAQRAAQKKALDARRAREQRVSSR